MYAIKLNLNPADLYFSLTNTTKRQNNTTRDVTTCVGKRHLDSSSQRDFPKPSHQQH